MKTTAQTTTTKARTTATKATSRKKKFGAILFIIISFIAVVTLGIVYYLSSNENSSNETNENSTNEESTAAAVDKYQQFENQQNAEQQTAEHQSAEPDVTNEESTASVVWGIDVSHWNVEMTSSSNFPKKLMEAGCQFVYIQIGKTKANVIEDYWEYAKEVAQACEEAKLMYGFYYLTEADIASEMYMELWYITRFYKDILPNMELKYHQLPFCIDFEYNGEEKPEELKQLTALVSELHSEDIFPIIYSSQYMLPKLEEALNNPQQEYWMANHALNDTGIAPLQFPVTMRLNQQIICWQYASDALLFAERGVDIDNQSLDRNLMPYNVWAYYHDRIEE